MVVVRFSPRRTARERFPYRHATQAPAGARDF